MKKRAQFEGSSTRDQVRGIKFEVSSSRDQVRGSKFEGLSSKSGYENYTT